MMSAATDPSQTGRCTRVYSLYITKAVVTGGSAYIHLCDTPGAWNQRFMHLLGLRLPGLPMRSTCRYICSLGSSGRRELCGRWSRLRPVCVPGIPRLSHIRHTNSILCKSWCPGCGHPQCQAPSHSIPRSSNPTHFRSVGPPTRSFSSSSRSCSQVQWAKVNEYGPLTCAYNDKVVVPPFLGFWMGQKGQCRVNFLDTSAPKGKTM